MIRVPPGAVILDPAEVDYVARALEHFAVVMAGRRDTDGNPTPSTPSPKLVVLTAKLRRAAGDSADALTLGELAADVDGPPELSVRPSDACAPQRDSMHAGPHDDIGTGDAARALGITASAVRDLARRGRLPARHTGTRWVYPAAAVDAEAKRRATQRRRPAGQHRQAR